MTISPHSPAWIALGWTFLHVLWIAAAIGLAASIARRAMRRASPEARHAAALAGLLALAASPFAAFVAVYEPAPTAAFVAPAAVAPRPPAAESSPGLTAAAPAPPALRADRAPIANRSWFEPWISFLPAAWLAGTSLLLARTAAGVVGVERLRRSLKPHELGPVAMRCRAMARSLGTARDVSIAACDRVAAPMLIGIVRPMVVLPAAALSGWDRDLVEMALLHELAHLRRLDNLTSLFQQFVEALLFFHPTTWWLSAWLRLERESCCDALVVARTGDAVGYARLLAALADARPPALAAPLNERPITTRIRRILFMEDRPMTLKPTAPEALALAAAALLAASLTLPARGDDPAAAKKPDAAADLRRLAEIVAAQPSSPPPSQPADGPPPPDERIMTLLGIATAQVKMDDRVGALETLRGASIETPAAADLGRGYRALYAVEYLVEAAAIRYDAGDVEGARDRFHRLVALLGEPDPDRDGPMVRTMERWAARTAASVSSHSEDDSQVILDVTTNDAKGADGEPEADPALALGHLELLASLADALAKRKEVDILHSLADRGLALTDQPDAPLAKALFQDVFGKMLVLAGDEAAGRGLTAKARDAVAAMPAGDVKDGTALLLASTLAETDLDGALDQIRTAAPGRRNRALRRLLEHLGETRPGPWLDANGLKINIGDPYLAMKDRARARADLPKILAVARTVEDAKGRARTLAVLARLQAQADDLAGALATAESMPDLRRADHPGPADGFYDAVKPATFALIARHRAQAGDAAGAEAALARSAELTNAVADEVERIVSGLVLADAYETAGRRDAARAVLDDILPRAQAQPEPRRSRLLGAIAREQVKSAGVAEASKTIDAIRDETGVEKANALWTLATHLRDAGDAEAARAAARRGLVCLRPKASDPKPESNFHGSVTRDGFIDYDVETPAAWLATWRGTIEPSLRAIVGEPEVELVAMDPEQGRRRLSARVAEAFRGGGLVEALKVAEAVEDPSSRAFAIRSLADHVASESLRR
ncbi:MAG: hypothetical protein BGO49_04620 [Planctomycetales bacterium 71-10]|mgnify:CR=1 FL=1|nr:MAG: hypothetical protein BGO49_04620 [Planctomycetales bacterium 71-10]